MDRNFTRTGLINWLLLLGTAFALFFLTRSLHLQSGWLAVVFVSFGFLASLVSYFQMRLEERERLEGLDYAELAREKSGATLFNSTDAESFPARRSREQFERFFVPAFTTILFLLQAATLWWQWRELRKAAPAITPDSAPIAMTICGLLWLVLFLFGKYSASLARIEDQRLLRPAASYVMLASYICVAVAVAIGMVVWGGMPAVDRYLAWAFWGLMALLALETLAVLVLEAYRPRVRGKAGRLVYDSRLVGLIGHPESLFTTAAHALDYQFGFKVSETGFYRFLRQWTVALVFVQLVILLLSSAVVFIEPGEQGLLERFGKPVPERAVLQPGAHLVFPWPMDKVYRYTNAGIQSFSIGFVPDPAKEKNEKTVLWNVSHYKEEFNLLVASRNDDAGSGTNNADTAVNLLTASIPVHYLIKDVRGWATNYTSAGRLLEDLASREVVQYFVGADMNTIMAEGRLAATRDLKVRIQKRADELALGVSILFVGLQDIHPPVKVADAYQGVIGARQEVEARLLAAEGYREGTLARARAEATRRVTTAEGERSRRISEAASSASQFTNQMTALAAAPTTYPQRLQLQALSRAIGGSRKYVIIPTNTHDVFQLNLEDKIRPDLGDIIAPTRK